MRQYASWADKYDSVQIFTWYCGGLYQRILKILIDRYGEILKKAKVLDVACGTGTLLLELQKRFPQASLQGVDISPEMITRAKKKSSSNLLFTIGNAAQLNFPDETFDLVICSESLHHFDEPEQSMREFWRVLKRGGRVLIVDPAVDTFMQKFIFRWAGRFFETAHHVYTRTELASLCRGAGFTIEYENVFRLNNFIVGIKASSNL